MRFCPLVMELIGLYIDEDIAIDGLLGIVHQKEQKRKTA